LRHWSEICADTGITLNCCSYRCSLANCGPWIAGIYLAMQNVTEGLFMEMNWHIREWLTCT